MVANEARVDGIMTTPAVVPARSAGFVACTPGAMAMPTGAWLMRLATESSGAPAATPMSVSGA